MVAAGIAVVAVANIREFDLVGIGKVLVIVGAVVAAYAKLKVLSGATHDAFLTGLERGRDEGFEEGFLEGQKTKPERPVLIDLAATAARYERERAGN